MTTEFADETFVNSEVRTLFPVPILISQVDNAAALNKQVLRDIKDLQANTPNGRPESWTAPVYTSLNSADQLHHLPQFTPLITAINVEVARFAEALGMDYQRHPLRMKDCWFNIYGPKDGQEPHNHPNSFISGTYYVKAPDGCSGIRFHSPTQDTMFIPPQTSKNELNGTMAELPVEDGLLVLFPSWLKHSVQPNSIRGERISISFNVFM